MCQPLLWQRPLLAELAFHSGGVVVCLALLLPRDLLGFNGWCACMHRHAVAFVNMCQPLLWQRPLLAKLAFHSGGVVVVSFASAQCSVCASM